MELVKPPSGENILRMKVIHLTRRARSNEHSLSGYLIVGVDVIDQGFELILVIERGIWTNTSVESSKIINR